ncbi:spore protease YyaC [Lentibacillus daqui]|uniref:spore protease YyaC n=1 Tax=Lentibacillus daqui TaxID=2911514 RepID=UPI0022B10E92|nr:spore protease YyaC [Lentibacillus daqui]
MNLKKQLKTKNDVFRMDYTDPDLLEIMGEKLISWLPKFPHEYVIVCIGTDRSTGDALGPLIGSFFTELRPRHMTVYGTLKKPVHAANLHDYVRHIERRHRCPFIIAIDACLGKSRSVGSIVTGVGPIKPGAAMNKQLPEIGNIYITGVVNVSGFEIGNIYITGVVNVSGFMEYSVLQNTRLSIVIDMAKKVTAILDQIDRQLTHGRKLPAMISQKNIASSKIDI